MPKAKKTRPAGADGTVVRHRKARHKYAVLDRLEVGIVLTGGEVKSLREGTASLEGAFAYPRGRELFLIEAQIQPYSHQVAGLHDPRRPRKLLLHRRQIDKLIAKVAQKGCTLVPLSIYFVRGRAKVELALCTGKTGTDKRRDLKEAEAKRNLARVRKAQVQRR